MEVKKWMLYYFIINTGSDKASLPQGQKIPLSWL